MEEIEPSKNFDPDFDIYSDRYEAADTLWGRHPWTTLLDLDWSHMCGSTAALRLVDAGLPQGFVAFCTEPIEEGDDTRLLVAAIEPRENRHVVAACIYDLRQDNASLTSPPARAGPQCRHWTLSSARASSEGGMVRPGALAVLRL